MAYRPSMYSGPFRPPTPQESSEELNRLKEEAKKRLQAAEKKVIVIEDRPNALKIEDGPPSEVKSQAIKIESGPIPIESKPVALKIEDGPQPPKKTEGLKALKIEDAPQAQPPAEPPVEKTPTVLPVEKTIEKPVVPEPSEDELDENDPDRLLNDEIIEFCDAYNNEKPQRPYPGFLRYSVDYLTQMKDNESTPPFVNPELHKVLFTNEVLGRKTAAFARGRNKKRKLKEVERLAISMNLTGDLNKAEKRWEPPKASKDSIDGISSLLTGFLNKLTRENFKVVQQNIEDALSEETEVLAKFVELVFNKAINEPGFCGIYAESCKRINDKFKGKLFPLIAAMCQQAFENRPNWSKLQAEIEHQTHGQDMGEEELNIIYLKKRALGNIRFVGSLFQQGLLSPKIIIFILNATLNEEVEDDIEMGLVLASTCGGTLKEYCNATPNAKPRYLHIFQRIEALTKANVSSRIRFMCMDVLDLKRKNFQTEGGPMTLKELSAKHSHKKSQSSHSHRKSSSTNLSKKPQRQMSVKKMDKKTVETKFKSNFKLFMSERSGVDLMEFMKDHDPPADLYLDQLLDAKVGDIKWLMEPFIKVYANVDRDIKQWWGEVSTPAVIKDLKLDNPKTEDILNEIKSILESNYKVKLSF